MPYKDPFRQLQYQRDYYARGGASGRHQIYALLDPDRKPRYVGRSVSAATRAKTHWSQRSRRQTAVARWLRDLDRPPELWIIQDVPAATAAEAEVYWIGLLANIPGIELLNINRRIKMPDLGLARGEANKSTHLTEADVRAIRTSSATQQALADKYGISQPAVSNIRSRRVWKHVALSVAG
jgi:hypothetical protein